MSPPLPRLLVLTDRHACAARGRTLTETVVRIADSGRSAIVLREKDLGGDARLRLALELQAALDGTGGSLIIASDWTLARQIGAYGVHLATTDPPAASDDVMVGRSCHDATELRAAGDSGADYVTLSPVFASSSKPGYGPPLHVDRLIGLTARAELPVYALGGVRPEHIRSCLRAGAYGVAAMGAVMGALDPRGVVADFLGGLAGG